VAGPTAGAEREHDRRGHGRNGCQRAGDADAATPSPAQRERGRRQLGGEPRIETRRHGRRQRFAAEPGQLREHGLVLAVRHPPLEARVVHVG
jgi:hypothetical protein